MIFLLVPILARLDFERNPAFSLGAAAHPGRKPRANLLARRKSRNGAGTVARVRAASQGVQRRIILRMEDHPITVQVTRASFVFISPFRLALPLRANLCPSSSSSSSFTPSPSSREISYAIFSVRQHRGEKREIIRTSVKQRLSRIFVPALSQGLPGPCRFKAINLNSQPPLISFERMNRRVTGWSVVNLPFPHFSTVSQYFAIFTRNVLI